MIPQILPFRLGLGGLACSEANSPSLSEELHPYSCVSWKGALEWHFISPNFERDIMSRQLVAS